MPAAAVSAIEHLAAALGDRYRIERELGQGGMATVYLAEDLKHRRKVAIKVLRPELAAVIGAERFLREIQTIATLQHPHILGLIDSGEVHGTAYYVMPFVDGESLRDRLTREKQLPIADAVRLATRGRRGAGLRPPPRRDPPRHQAREHPAARRLGAGGRLRHRAGGLQRGRRQPDDRDRHVARHAALHESRAGDGRAGDHRPRRCVRAGRDDVRDAGGRAALHRPHRAGDRGQGDDGGAGRAHRPAEERAAARWKTRC